MNPSGFGAVSPRFRVVLPDFGVTAPGFRVVVADVGVVSSGFVFWPFRFRVNLKPGSEALKGRSIPAQGNALGKGGRETIALKGWHSLAQAAWGAPSGLMYLISLAPRALPHCH